MKEPVRSEGAQFVRELPDRFNELGAFIREQTKAQIDQLLGRVS